MQVTINSRRQKLQNERNTQTEELSNEIVKIHLLELQKGERPALNSACSGASGM